MSRTLRRLRHRYGYYWVLRKRAIGQSARIKLDPRSEEGRKSIGAFHSDKEVTMGPAPRRYRKVLDHQIRTRNNRLFRRWLANPDYEPIFQTWHKPNANWSWWWQRVFTIRQDRAADACRYRFATGLRFGD